MRLKDRQIGAYGAGKAGGNGKDGESQGDRPGDRPGDRRLGKDRPAERKDTPNKGSAPPQSGTAKPKTPSLPSFLKTDTGELAYRKVAKFLIILGKDEGAKILALLEPAQIERVTAEIAAVRSVSPEEAERLLDEFGLRAAKAALPRGGIDAARDMLVKAFGRERGLDFLRRAAPADVPKPFDFLLSLEPPQALLLLKDESLAVAALVLSRVEPAYASKVIARMSDAEKREVVLRIARMGKVDPDVLARTQTALEEKARKLGKVVTEEIDGASALAGILRYMSPSSERLILDALDEGAPAVVDRVKEGLFTLEDVLDVPPRDLQEALRLYKDEALALVLKGKDGPFRDRVMANLSEGRRRAVEDEGLIMGAVRREDIDAATRDFLGYFKRLREEGKLVLLSDEGEYIR